MKRLHKLCVSLALFAGIALPVAVSAQPHRVVSLNLCADQWVLLLARPEHVKSVTWLARDPDISGMAAQAATVPVNYGLAEELIPLKPDLAVAGVYTTRTTVAFMQRLGIPVLDLDVPRSVDAMLAQVRQVALALGEVQRGEQLIAQMNARLSALANSAPAVPINGLNTPRPIAAIWQANGGTVGPGSLLDELLTRAGFDNLATRQGIGQYGQLPLEALLLGQPDILILNSTRDRLPSQADELLRHPALAAAFPAARTLVVPQQLWTCGGPGVVEAIEILTHAARELAVPEQH